MHVISWVRTKSHFIQPDIGSELRRIRDMGIEGLLLLASGLDSQLESVLSAAKNAGVEAHLWVKPTVGMKDTVNRTLSAERREAQRAKWNIDLARPCLNHPKNIEGGLSGLERLIKKTAGGIAGVHLDYMRNDNAVLIREYPCQCDACQAARSKWLGHGTLSDDDLRDPSVMFKELELRNRSTREFVRRAHELVQRHGLPLSLAARANYLNQPDITEPPVYGLGPAVYEGQDWVAWAEAGYLDFICTMNYHVDPVMFERVALEHARLLEGTSAKYYSGIGVSSSMGKADPERMRLLIDRAASTGAHGCSLFHLSAVTDEHAGVLRALAQ